MFKSRRNMKVIRSTPLSFYKTRLQYSEESCKSRARLVLAELEFESVPKEKEIHITRHLAKNNPSEEMALVKLVVDYGLSEKYESLAIDQEGGGSLHFSLHNAMSEPQRQSVLEALQYCLVSTASKNEPLVNDENEKEDEEMEFLS